MREYYQKQFVYMGFVFEMGELTFLLGFDIIEILNEMNLLSGDISDLSLITWVLFLHDIVELHLS